MTYGSVYEITNKATTVAKYRFVDNFSGRKVDERWTTNAFAGGTMDMSDTINCGVYLASSTSNNARLALTFNNLYQFDQTGSSIIMVTALDKNGSTGNYGCNCGFLGGAYNATTESDSALLKNNTAEGSNMQFFTKNGSSGVTDTGIVVRDTNTFFTTKIDLGTLASCSLDGVLVAQRSVLPNKAVMPYIQNIMYSGGVSTISHISYCEAYNT